MRILKSIESFLKTEPINEGRIYWSPRFTEVIKKVYDTTDNKKVKEMSIEDLKNKLIKGGLIKPNSKAPESVLRQIAADAEVVKNKAL